MRIRILLTLGLGLGLGCAPGDSTPSLMMDMASDGRGDLAMPFDLRQLSDEFTGTALDPGWQIFKPQSIDVTVSNGSLHIAPQPNALWFNMQQGGLVYKVVSGDFRISSRVHAHVRNMSNSTPPTAGVQLAGLVARAPVAEGVGAPEDYVFIVVGFDVNDLSVEHKSTDDGVSNYQGPPWAGGEAELRLCRLGASFHLYKRMLGAGSWTNAISYTRTDLPAALQVGVTAYTNRATPDVVGSFDSVDLAPAATIADCTADVQ